MDIKTDEILKKIEENRKRIEDVYVSVEKTRKYFLWTLIITIVVIVLPFIILIAILPQFIDVLTSGYDLIY